ncbi:hypothetical protein [uncultured Nostoc sp.]|uniref:hypothetical protein n=1 Tax=uncultured Nostoc sp. TaxID=340711 RepID=UPI00260E5F46|nr:hypothetical protein [uncultured Nostoc sp.]
MLILITQPGERLSSERGMGIALMVAFRDGVGLDKVYLLITLSKSLIALSKCLFTFSKDLNAFSVNKSARINQTTRFKLKPL